MRFKTKEGDVITVVESELQDDLEERLGFEKLLAETSARFINLPAERIDEQIEDAQRRICECLNLDLSSLWQWTDGPEGFMTVTHLFSPPEGPERPENINAAESFPWIFQKMMQGQILTFSNADLPPQAERDKASRRHYGIKSSVDIPLQIGGDKIIGILTFDTLHSTRSWSEETVGRLKLVSQIFSNALARKQTEKLLRQSEARLSLAADSAGAGIWELDCESLCFWATEHARSIFKFEPEEIISMERFEASVHPDDIALVRLAIRNALDKGEPINAEYRIRVGDGKEKWVCSRGRAYFKPDGKPDRLMGVTTDISENKHMENELNARLKEIEKLKRQCEKENLYLRQELQVEKGFEKIVGQSKAIKSVIIAAKQVAATDATVLIFGETGTGKGLVANAIHRMSTRKNRPLVTVNCSALPGNLIESELFGREKGAFTGAHARQAGRFEVADGGTIFLDEIGEMPLELQSKLLRVLQEGEFERLGSAKTIKVNVRVIAATGLDLRKETREMRFREDLFYRLNVFPISIPPLRKRTEDIALLARYFMDKYSRQMGKQIDSIPESTLSAFMDYDWPGNVRELEHVIERGVIITSGRTFRMAGQLEHIMDNPVIEDRLKDLATVEREHILSVLRETDWRIEGVTGAAAILKLHPSTLRFRMSKLGIHRPA